MAKNKFFYAEKLGGERFLTHLRMKGLRTSKMSSPEIKKEFNKFKVKRRY